MDKPPLPINVGSSERVVSILGGLIMIVQGIRRGTVPSFGLALLGAAFVIRGATGHCGGYAACGLDRSHPTPKRKVIRAQIEINRRPGEVYQYWRKPQQVGRLSESIELVREIDEFPSFWKVKTPVGRSVEWHAQIIEDHPDEIIAWESLPETDFENAGSVRFESTSVGSTLVHVAFAFQHPGSGTPAGQISKNIVQTRVEEALLRLKQILEA